jgi:diaminohydroxyphosphoribosylaminopyrimidine deaminase/5-amino-6-(5-phosphoribosylamino)uracil reductase
MDDAEHMRRAMALAASVRSATAPNPWVGCVVVPADSDSGSDSARTTVFEGATAPPGGAHAEVAALRAAGEQARGATLVTTLEPCAHQGRTPPCTDAIIEAGVARVVVGLEDPDPQVAGRGVAALRAAGIEVTVGVGADEVAEQLAPYLKHRRTGRPWVVLKMAASLDARTAAPDGTSRWITGEAARHDVHLLRASSDAVLVGAGTVRADDPELTVRLDDDVERTQPLRVVLGKAPDGARVHPALELEGDLDQVLLELACSSFWSRAGPPWPTNSTRPGSSTATCSTWRRCFSGATTGARSLPARGLAQLAMCGRGSSCRWNALGTICEWRWPPDGLLDGT